MITTAINTTCGMLSKIIGQVTNGIKQIHGSQRLRQSNTDPRYYNEAFTYGADNPATHTSCKDLPNVNEMTWYAAKGEPRWDADELWTTMGHLSKGGMWFKKKANISEFNPNTAEDGTDWRTNGRSDSWGAVLPRGTVSPRTSCTSAVISSPWATTAAATGSGQRRFSSSRD